MRRRLRSGALLLAIALAAAAGVHAADWADEASPLTRSMSRSKAICRAMKPVVVPTEPDAPRAEACDAEALYAGIGMKADPVAARRCAASHAAAPAKDDLDPFDGDSLLMMIYANGRGTPRRLDYALALACRLDGAPAEMDGRVLHLDRMRAEGWSGTDFSVCDDATSGLLGGYCARHAARLATAERSRRLDGLAASLDPARRQAFARLREAEEAYARAVGENEVDLSGTLRAAMQIEAQQRQDAEFLDLAEAVASGKVPAGAAADYRSSDAKLNAVYAKLMAAKDASAWGTVEKAGIRKAQRAWLVYRDGFVAFARTAPGPDPDAVASALTAKRSAWLAELGG